MFNKLIILLTLSAFLLSATGCMHRKSVRFYADELPKHVKTSIDVVHLSSGEREIALKNNEVIVVSAVGIHRDTIRNVLVTRDTSGAYVEIDIDDISPVQSHHINRVIFDARGGRIDLEKQIIHGMTTEQSVATVAFSDVYYVTGKSLNSEFNVAGSLVLFSLAITYGLLKTMADGIKNPSR